MTERLPRIAVLMAAYNRREMTLQAMRPLVAGRGHFELTIVLLDDGSTDGTTAAVRSACPDVIVLAGDGNAFWNGGMHQAWKHALSLDVDGYLWLNDDVILDEDSLPRLAMEWAAQGGAKSPFILVGATRDDTGRLSYGGQRLIPSPFALHFEHLPIADVLTKAETFNGNIVLVSGATERKIGINDQKFLHTLGDIDYGLRATRAGIPVLVMPGTLGVCNHNTPIAWNGGTMLERYRKITSHRGIPIRNWWRITRRYSGVWMPLHFLLPYRKIFMK